MIEAQASSVPETYRQDRRFREREDCRSFFLRSGKRSWDAAEYAAYCHVMWSAICDD